MAAAGEAADDLDVANALHRVVEASLARQGTLQLGESIHAVGQLVGIVLVGHMMRGLRASVDQHGRYDLTSLE
eukprot:419897-Pyramimonas_sp.AAC.1